MPSLRQTSATVSPLARSRSASFNSLWICSSVRRLAMGPSLDWLGRDYHISWIRFWGADQSISTCSTPLGVTALCISTPTMESSAWQCAQRLSASLLSAFRRGVVLLHGRCRVLNASRRHCSLHDEVKLEAKALELIVLNASRRHCSLHNQACGDGLAAGIQCSTPLGVTALCITHL